MATPAGIVVVAHGGSEHSTRPVTAIDPPVLRMIPVAWAIRHAVRGSGVAVWRHRFEVRGWNGDQASPVGDLNRLLDDIRARYDGIAVVLAGHSMGARAAFRAAGHPAVCAVAGLAPWLPLGEPAAQLAGRRVLLAHGTADTVTSPAETWAYAARARAVTSVTALEVRGGDHPMLRRASLWHAISAEFTRLSFGLPSGSGPAAAAVRAAATSQASRTTPV
ncbi:MAG TPA: alpha/beta hydrolase [Streptosporangiaceae bacterium]|nr:alpha/beta hydrolase [Streptosporangiaceae bacterium]